MISELEGKQKSYVVTFTVPKDLKDILDQVSGAGYYDSLSEFLRDAIRSMLRTQKGFATMIAFRLYKAKRISIGKAAVLLGCSLEETKQMFASLET